MPTGSVATGGEEAASCFDGTTGGTNGWALERRRTI